METLWGDFTFRSPAVNTVHTFVLLITSHLVVLDLILSEGSEASPSAIAIQ